MFLCSRGTQFPHWTTTKVPKTTTPNSVLLPIHPILLSYFPLIWHSVIKYPRFDINEYFPILVLHLDGSSYQPGLILPLTTYSGIMHLSLHWPHSITGPHLSISMATLKTNPLCQNHQLISSEHTAPQLPPIPIPLGPFSPKTLYLLLAKSLPESYFSFCFHMRAWVPWGLGPDWCQPM